MGTRQNMQVDEPLFLGRIYRLPLDARTDQGFFIIFMFAVSNRKGSFS